MEQEPQQKATYEQLEQAVNQLSQINMQMRQKLEQQNYANFHQRMAYLFEIVRNSDKFSSAFVQKCIEEIEYSITIPEEEEQGDTPVIPLHKEEE